LNFLTPPEKLYAGLVAVPFVALRDRADAANVEADGPRFKAIVQKRKAPVKGVPASRTSRRLHSDLVDEDPMVLDFVDRAVTPCAGAWPHQPATAPGSASPNSPSSSALRHHAVAPTIRSPHIDRARNKSSTSV